MLSSIFALGNFAQIAAKATGPTAALTPSHRSTIEERAARLHHSVRTTMRQRRSGLGNLTPKAH